MTFYWWSHWFWITLICNLFIFPIMVVHTYPSLDSSLERNQHEQAGTKKMVTKLYQASTTLTWFGGDSTTGPTATKTTPYSMEKTRLQSISATTMQPSNTTPLTPEPEITKDTKKLADGFTDYYYYDDEYDNKGDDKPAGPLKLEDMEEEQERKQQQESYASHEKQNDIKRSAEDLSKIEGDNLNTATLSTSMTSSTQPSTSSNSVRSNKNNYTNFTEPLASSGSNNTAAVSQTPDFSSNPSTSNSLKANIRIASSVSVLATSINSLSALTANNVTQLPHIPPGTPKIARPPDWLRSMDDAAAAAATSPPPLSVTTDVTDDKFPFTLENVHKSEDLRRDENEPRRRQSKGLSADYKQPGYINYSPESKNLLTRSASTTVNDYDSEESNISSEALSVQRAYFMDVGAISAICFTVFGICCTVGTIGIVLYRRRFLNKPQALSEPDSSVYIDDSTMRVSDNSDEMYSLDNDSFLNSLEAMTIQNYWTDTVKHTKL
ncbi:uncharacterized protein isoform X2 [Musca autumnalis]|uniref:uncharacterized protein isoform X2 n=1 Tax=Musca autumnalis TaxID=221902 RepID=UPI003CED6F72